MAFRKKYLAGVSGGPDSMALLNIYRHQIGGVCHVNYAKRSSADRDEQIVRNFCLRYKIPFFCLKANELNRSLNHEKNFQTHARKLRYDFYLKCAKQTHCQKLLLGHHLDDSLESAYDQLKRNVTTLFYGIRKKGNYGGLTVIRPLIQFRKQELMDYCVSHKIEFGIDETNFLDLYRRNQIRKIISDWTPKEFRTFEKEIQVKNKKLHRTQKLLERSYKKWQRQNYSQKFFLNLPSQVQTLALYKYLSEYQILCRSRYKLDLIAKFISKQLQPKSLRIHRQKFLRIQNGCLCVVSK